MPGSDASQFTRFKKAIAVQRGDTQQTDPKSVNRLTNYIPRLSNVSCTNKFLSSLTKKSSCPSGDCGDGAITILRYSEDQGAIVPWASNTFTRNANLPEFSYTSCSITTSIPAVQVISPASLTSVTIPNSVKTIGDFAFFNCSSLTPITIPDSVISIGEGAFNRCSSLTIVTIPNSVKTIGDFAFDECSSLETLIIGNSVETIGESAFEECSSLETVVIGNSVETIGFSAFYDCSLLATITIPDSVTSIGGSAFEECSSLTTVTISSNTAAGLGISSPGQNVNFFGKTVETALPS